MIITLAIVPKWGIIFWSKIDKNSTLSLLGVLITFLINFITIQKLIKFPGAQAISYILPTPPVLMGI